MSSIIINLDRVREVRFRWGDDNDWELKLDPPVTACCPWGGGIWRACDGRWGFDRRESGSSLR
jgi:hypothetical protein